MADISKLFGPSWPPSEDALARASRAIQDPATTLVMHAYRDPGHLTALRDLVDRQSDIFTARSAIEEATRRLLGEPDPARGVLEQLYGDARGGAMQRVRDSMNADELFGVRNALRDTLALYGYPSVAGGAFHDIYQEASLAAKSLHDAYREASWAHVMGAASRAEMDALFPNTDGLMGSELQHLRDITSGVHGASEAQRLAIDIATGRATFLSPQLDTTVLKLSTLIGAQDILGPETALGEAAFEALFGSYRTTLDLPLAFWRRPEVRREIYEDAAVDPGLIEADNDEVVEILIGGGVATQVERRDGRVAAAVRIGPFEMRVTATRPRHDAFAILDAFEIALRAFISRKLEVISGEHWFKHRVSGDVLIRAKNRRKEALRNGEPTASLINFTDLGDLMGIIVRQDNWDGVFGATFQHIERFRVDMERMVAMRRPTAHARSIDSVRLLEIVCVVLRLQGAMEHDQPLDAGWDSDE